MPQSSERVGNFDLTQDLNSYYKGCVVTYRKVIKDSVEYLPAWVEKFAGENETKAHIRILGKTEGTPWGGLISVPQEALDFIMPPLGMVQVAGGHWVHVFKAPARRMRKGYHTETVHVNFLEGDFDCAHQDGPMCKEIIRQLWYGSPDRIATNVAVWEKGIFYAADKVATIDEAGVVCLIPGKEKVGEFVCKLLANNWDLVVSKYSIRTLPSSVPML